MNRISVDVLLVRGKQHDPSHGNSAEGGCGMVTDLLDLEDKV